MCHTRTLTYTWIVLLIFVVVQASVLQACTSSSIEYEETKVPKHASTLIAQRGEATWELVALGDSTPTGYGVGIDHSYVQIYAGYIEEDLGVTVEVHNWSTNSTRAVSDWVEEVRSNGELKNDLQNAEVVTLWMGWHDLVPSIGVVGSGPCYKPPHEIDLDCLSEVTNPMLGAFDDLLSEITTLSNPSETLILIADVGIPPHFVEKWREDGTLDVMSKHAYEVWRGHILQAASKYGVHVVPTWNGLSQTGESQMIASEYMLFDGLHFNKKGHKLIADIHRKVGYEYSK
jgi:hypothetical protein